ncbi:MAG: hypothetical protein JST82_14100 [Bacteroidetes bacterium]|nr:hypothetical protein [Bacteroidota bacterium]
MISNLYYIMLFAVTVFAVLFLFMYMLYRHFVQKLERQQRESVQAILETQENERRTIALEVHDNLGPLLSITNMRIEALTAATDNEHAKGELNHVHKQLKDAIFVCRDISHELTPFLNTEIGLQQMISDHVQKINAAGKLQVVFNCNIADVKIHHQKSASLCRVLMELLNNTIKHAHAQQAVIDMGVKGTQFILGYTDDGVGMKATTGNGIGMKNIQSRVQLLNGQLQTVQHDGKGVDIRIKIPLKELI